MYTPPKQYDQKATNPKDVIGSTKLPLHCVPPAIVAYASLAFLEGALKYGRFNWRIAGVRTMIYIDALERHIARFKDGEWADSKTKVPHLASAIACLGIILDAHTCGKLNDDRPPAAPTGDLIDNLVPAVAHLKELFKGHNPHQYTIEDSEHGHTRAIGGVLQEVPGHSAGQEGSGGAEPGSAGS